MSQKKAALINSLSCYGKSSLTVGIPILATAGVEASLIPTAVFSTHTGFSDFVFKDMSDMVLPIAQHWNAEGVDFDAVSVGYLANEEQISSVIKAIKLIAAPEALIIVDPVMGDSGELYKRFSKSFPQYMLNLCRVANIITPNITEACLLTGKHFKADYDEDYITELASGLYDLTGANVVITGISFDERKIGVAVYKGESVKYVFCDKVPASFHGSGDIFSAGLTASLLNERGLRAAAEIAQNFVCGCIKASYENEVEEKSGISFEKQLPNLIKYLCLG